MLIRSPKEMAIHLAAERKQRKMSQSTVADAVGLKQSTVSALENKPDNIRLDTLFRVPSALDLDIQLVPKAKHLESEW